MKLFNAILFKIKYWYDLTFKKEEFTCHTCNYKFGCKFTYDPYNKDGDCLFLK